MEKCEQTTEKEYYIRVSLRSLFATEYERLLTKFSHDTDCQNSHRYRHAFLVHISEIGVLLVGQILKRMDVALVVGLGHTGRSGIVTLLVEACQIEAQEDDDEQQEHVAAHVGGKSGEVARCVVVAEDLGACVMEC
jgi:hypothetical protein